ncbi:MAG: fused MFS/spermidine synthase [Planctomycetota bacterium]
MGERHDRGHRTLFLLIVVALAGAGTMTVELAAVRLLAPWFGASAGVWTNVIGVILLALALGYLVGARLSRGVYPTRALGTALVLAGAATAWLPYGARPVAEFFMPAELALEQAAELLVWGSLAASLLLFLPAALLLGCMGPLAVEVLSRARACHAGDAGGRVLAASTAGSLVGTFATTHLLLPVLGIDITFLVAAGALGCAGIWVLLRSENFRPPALAGVLLLLSALIASRQDQRPVRAGQTLLAARESRYQMLRVVEQGQGPDLLRTLQVNEGFDSFQSVWQPASGLLPSGYYYNYFVLPAWWEGARGEWRTLILGLGAGTAVRVMQAALPQGARLHAVGVEIDPEVVRLGEQFFDLESEVPGRVVFAGLDARSALRWVSPGFDQVVLDCYANNMEVPAHLSTVEFFREQQEVLREGGWLSVNAAGFGLNDPVVAALAQTLAVAFDQRVLAVRVPFSRNAVLYVRRAGSVPQPGSPGWAAATGAVADLLTPVAIPGAWRWFEPGASAGIVLTDDRNPIDRLQLSSIAGGRGRFLE